MVKELSAKPPLGCRPAIVDAIHRSESESPVNVVGLHRVRNAFNSKYTLIELKPVRNGSVRLRDVRLIGSTGIDSYIRPTIHLNSGSFERRESGPKSFRERVDRVGIGHTYQRCRAEIF